MLSNPVLYIRLGRINSALEPASGQIFLHLSVVQMLHRQKQQLNKVRKYDYEQAVPDMRQKVIVLLQQFFNSLSKKRLGMTMLTGKKAKGALDYQLSSAAAGSFHNRERILRDAQ